MKGLARCIHILDSFLPKRNAVVLRGYPDIEDQCLSLLIALSQRSYPGKTTWILTDKTLNFPDFIKKYKLENLTLNIRKHSEVRAIIDYLFSRYVFFTHGLYTYDSWENQKPPHRKRVVNLWHGMPFKQLWIPIGLSAPPAQALLATSGLFQKILSDLSGMPEESVWVTGLPRNDMLFYKNTTAETVISGLVDEKKWFLYLPTYRQARNQPDEKSPDGVEFNSVLNMSGEEARTLDQWLASVDRKIVVKAHPSSIHSGSSPLTGLKNIILLNEIWFRENQITLYELAGYSEGLITDISSILVDYLLLDRPIFIYFPDQDAYDTSRGFVFDSLEENLPGIPVKDAKTLIQQMEQFLKGNDTTQERRKTLCKKFHSDPSPTAASRFLDRVGL